MQTEKIKELLDKFESACYEVAAIECWSARELQEILGYKDWRNFEKVLHTIRNGCFSGISGLVYGSKRFD